ncbi:hypothetical protein PSCICJ_04260 [Pseudomonas cichorii]|nr:hypothetical protein PSCICJ_04260 [Pseudomonas cichorii]
MRAARFDQVGRHTDFRAVAHGSRKSCQGRLAEEDANIRAQAFLTHFLDQFDGKQRVAAQLEEMVMTPHTLDFEHFCPERRQHRFDRPDGRFVITAGIRLRIGCWQCATVQLAVIGQRQAVQYHKGHGHHVIGQ